MTRLLPEGVYFQKKTLSGGQIVEYGYYRKAGERTSLGRKGTPEFFAAIADLTKNEPQNGTVHMLIWEYKKSPEFSRLAPRTRRDYLGQLDKVQERFGKLSFRAISAREIIPHIYNWRDKMADSPKQANYAVTVLKLLLAWGVKRGRLTVNMAANVDRLREGDRREKSWSEDEVSKFLELAPEPLKRAMTLALETGQRQNDLLTLTWGAISGNVISLRQKKTGKPVFVPVSSALRACLDGLPRGGSLTILTTSDGLPWDPKGNGFRAAWRAVAEKAGITDRTFHDLRGTFITRRLAEGWSPQQVAMCSGHSLRNLAMLDVYTDRAVVARAFAETKVAEEEEDQP